MSKKLELPLVDFEYIIEDDIKITLYAISPRAKKFLNDDFHFNDDNSVSMSIYNKNVLEDAGYILKPKEPH